MAAMNHMRKIIFYAIFILTVFWLISFFVSLKLHAQMLNAERERLGDLFELADYQPMWAYGWGRLVFLLGLLLCCAWVIIILKVITQYRKTSNGHSKTIALLSSTFFLIFLIGSVNFMAAAQSSDSEWEPPHYCWHNAVDILFVCDEELAEHQEVVDVDWIIIKTWKPSPWLIENWLFPKLKDRFLKESGISIKFHGWINWDSNDSEHDMDYLLIEAMEETGWIPQKIYREANHTIIDSWGRTFTLTHTKRMDILFVLTYQSTHQVGFAMTERAAQTYSHFLEKTVYWDACILKYPIGESDNLQMALLQHELSHLFGLPHCSNLCVMNPELVYYFHVSWCGSCKNEMRQWNRDQYPPD